MAREENLARQYLRFAQGNLLRSGCRADILIDPKQVGWVVFRLQGSQPRIVRTKGRLDPTFAFIGHHEVGIGTFEIEGMHGRPIICRPAFQRGGLGRIGSIPAITMDHMASRAPQAVSCFPTRWTAPSIG